MSALSNTSRPRLSERLIDEANRHPATTILHGQLATYAARAYAIERELARLHEDLAATLDAGTLENITRDIPR